MTEDVLIVGDRKFRITGNLGEGGFSQVKRGVDQQSEKKVALKLMFTDLDNSAEKASQKAQAHKEIKAMRALSHPNIVRLLGYDLVATYNKRPCIVLVQELAPNRELFDYLMYTSKFEEPLARSVFLQLVNGLKCVHDAGIAHRDLKPENLLFDKRYNLKIADFGFAYHWGKKGNMSTELGTRGYMAPEILRGGKYDCKVDVFASGVILFILLSGFPPFRETKSSDWWFDKVNRNKFNLFWAAHERKHQFPEKAKDLIEKMLHCDPEKRLTIDEVLKHGWTQGKVLSKEDYATTMKNRKTKADAKIKEKKTEATRAVNRQFMDKTSELTAFWNDGKTDQVKPLTMRTITFNEFRSQLSNCEDEDTFAKIMKAIGEDMKKGNPKYKKATAELAVFLKENGPIEELEFSDAYEGENPSADLCEVQTADDLKKIFDFGKHPDIANLMLFSMNKCLLDFDEQEFYPVKQIDQFISMDDKMGELPTIADEDMPQTYKLCVGLGFVTHVLQNYAKTHTNKELKKEGKIYDGCNVVSGKAGNIQLTVNYRKIFDLPDENGKDTKTEMKEVLVIDIQLYKYGNSNVNAIVFKRISGNEVEYKYEVERLLQQTQIISCVLDF